MRQVVLAIPVGLVFGIAAALACQLILVFAWRFLPHIWWNTTSPMPLFDRGLFFGFLGPWLLLLAAVSPIFNGWVVKIVDLKTKRVRILPRIYSRDEAARCAAHAAKNGPSSLKYERKRFLWV